MIEQEDRRFYYFYNENFSQTFVEDSKLQGMGLDEKLTHKSIQTYKFYVDHISQMTTCNKVHLLVSNKKLYK